MTEERLPLAELLQKAGDGDFLRAVAEAVLQLLPRPPPGGRACGDGASACCARWRRTWRA
jgi:hypothetical protein